MRTLSRGLAARFVGAVLLALAPSATVSAQTSLHPNCLSLATSYALSQRRGYFCIIWSLSTGRWRLDMRMCEGMKG